MRKRKLKDIPIYEVPKNNLVPYFGQAFRNHGVVRNDLPPRIKKHVSLHERVHIKYGKGEFFTNLISGFRDPVGFSATALATVKDAKRRAYYKQRAKSFFKRKK